MSKENNKGLQFQNINVKDVNNDQVQYLIDHAVNISQFIRNAIYDKYMELKYGIKEDGG